MSEIKPWPVEGEFSEQTPYGPGMTPVRGWDYETARAEAALSRLRVAVEALNRLADDARKAPDNDSAISDPIRWSIEVYAKRIVAAIGPIP